MDTDIEKAIDQVNLYYTPYFVEFMIHKQEVELSDIGNEIIVQFTGNHHMANAYDFVRYIPRDRLVNYGGDAKGKSQVVLRKI